MVPITPEDNQRALQRARSVRESDLAATSFRDLATIAEDCCCANHHRNKIWGSGLAQKLAYRWQNEIRNALGLMTYGTNLNVWTEYETAPVPVTFAKHQILQEETLLSKLQSDVEPLACKTGSLYFYTHADHAFSGMIKIGYTGRAIDSRLREWAECGNGFPKLLDSLSGVRHPERVELLIHFELAECWYAQRWCALHRRAHIEWFRTDHPSTLASMANLAYTWKSMGRIRDAIDLMRTCIRFQEVRLGVDHPNTQSSVLALDSWEKELM
jgi:hypothetical protein